MELRDPVVLTDPLYWSQQQRKSSIVSFYYCSNALSSKPFAQTLALLCTATLPGFHELIDEVLSLGEHLSSAIPKLRSLLPTVVTPCHGLWSADQLGI